jgi:predicted RNase H-like HicB family nuclease
MKTMLPLTIKLTVDRRSKDAPFIAYSPELDLASCGLTEEKARQNLHEAVEILLEEVDKKGKLSELLEEMGFQKEKEGWIPPRISLEPFFFPKLKLT